jgi:uncharacterized protein YjbJ (UPF0337 family)
LSLQTLGDFAEPGSIAVSDTPLSAPGHRVRYAPPLRDRLSLLDRQVHRESARFAVTVRSTWDAGLAKESNNSPSAMTDQRNPMGSPKWRFLTNRNGVKMSKKNKVKNTAQIAKGKIEEAAGRANGDVELEAEGNVDQAKGHVKQAGEHVKDALTN